MSYEICFKKITLKILQKITDVIYLMNVEVHICIPTSRTYLDRCVNQSRQWPRISYNNPIKISLDFCPGSCYKIV